MDPNENGAASNEPKGVSNGRGEECPYILLQGHFPPLLQLG